MFGQTCKGCGDKFYPFPGTDSGHGSCVGQTSDVATNYVAMLTDEDDPQDE